MRILLPTLLFPPEYNAGTENYTLALASSLLGRGHQVEVICADKWGMGNAYWNGVKRDLYQDVPINRIQFNWIKANNPNQVLYDNPTTEAWFDQFVKDTRPDIVHITSAITLGVGILRSVKRARVPLVLTLTDFWFICPTLQLLRSDGSLCDGKTSAWECQLCMGIDSRLFRGINSLIPDSFHPDVWAKASKFAPLARRRGMRGNVLDMTERKQILKQALSLPDRVFAPSRFVQQVFTQLTSTPVEVLRHGHDLSWIKKLKLKTSSDKLRFAYIGQLQPIKGVHVLIEAFQMAQIDDQATLSIFGDMTKRPDYLQELRTIASGSPSITFRGRFERDQLADVFANLDVVVVPSTWYENAPLVIQEAFAAQTPVIATDLGGMAEAVSHDVNGLLFTRNDSADLTRQLRRLIDEPDLLPQLRKGVPKVKTIEEEVRELEQIYRELAVEAAPSIV